MKLEPRQTEERHVWSLGFRGVLDLEGKHVENISYAAVISYRSGRICRAPMALRKYKVSFTESQYLKALKCCLLSRKLLWT